MGAVVEVQCAPHPVHTPPIPHAVRVVTLARGGVDGIAPAVDGDRSRYGAGDFVAGRDPVCVRRAGSGPDQIHRQLSRPAGLVVQQSGRVVVRAGVPGYLDPVLRQRDRRGVAHHDAVTAHVVGIRGCRRVEIQQRHGRDIGSADQGVDPGGLLVGHQAQPDPPADPLLLVGEVPVPTLVPQWFVAGDVCGFVGRIDLGGRRSRHALDPALGRTSRASVSSTWLLCRSSMVMNI